MKTIYSIFILLFTLLSVNSFAQTHKPTAKKTMSGLSTQVAAGQKVYLSRCLTCHQVDGGGVQNMNPPLIGTTYVLGDKTRLIKIVLNGFNERVEIDGDIYNNPMPAQSTLTDQEIADVLTYVRNSFGNKASAIHAPDVKKVRATAK
jgi:mono/diheme cytochrome c family protein